MRSSLIESIYHIYEDILAKAYTLLLSRCFHSIGAKTTIIPPLRFVNLACVELGSYVTIHRDCWIQTMKDPVEAGQKPKIIINNHASIGMGATLSAADSIVIEAHVFTARNVYITDHEHAYEDVDLPIARQHIRKIGPVRIGEHTWLGQNAVILPGVTIGKHCVIGANAVVNRDVPDYSVAAGIPAKVIKRYDFATSHWARVSSDE